MSVFKGHDDLSLNRYYYSFYSFSQDDPNTIKSFVYDQNQTLVSSKDISFNTRNISDMLSFLENSQSNPYALGKSNDEFLNMDITFAGLYKKALTETQQQSLMTTINKTYKNVYSNAIVVYAVTVANNGTNNVYYIDGVEQPAIQLTQNGLYVFDQSDSTNVIHPLRFQLNSDSTSYTTGVTVLGTQGTPNSYVMIEITDNTPILNYYCTNHSGMGNIFSKEITYTTTSQISNTEENMTDTYLNNYEIRVNVYHNADNLSNIFNTPSINHWRPAYDSAKGNVYRDPSTQSSSNIYGTLITPATITAPSGIYISAGNRHYSPMKEDMLYLSYTNNVTPRDNTKYSVWNHTGANEYSLYNTNNTTKRIYGDWIHINTNNNPFLLSKIYIPINKFHNSTYYTPTRMFLIGSNDGYNWYGLIEDRDVFGGTGIDPNDSVENIYDITDSGGNPNTTHKYEEELSWNETSYSHYRICFTGWYTSLGYWTGVTGIMIFGKSTSLVTTEYDGPLTTFQVSVSNESFYIDNNKNPILDLQPGNVYRFSQHDESNTNYPIKFSTITDGTHNSGTEYTTGIYTTGTPGEFNAHTIIDFSDNPYVDLYYYSDISSNMGSLAFNPPTYTVKVVDHEVTGEKVFSIQAPGTSTFINQPDLSFGAGDRYQFDVGDLTMADISLVFGTTVDDSASINESVVTRKNGLVILDISAGYTDERLVYFEDTSAGMGYVSSSSSSGTSGTAPQLLNNSFETNGGTNSDGYNLISDSSISNWYSDNLSSTHNRTLIYDNNISGIIDTPFGTYFLGLITDGNPPQYSGDIHQIIDISSNNYTLSWYDCVSSTYHNSIVPLRIEIIKTNDNTVVHTHQYISNISSVWTERSTSFTITENSQYKVRIRSYINNSNESGSVGIDNVTFSIAPPPVENYTVDVSNGVFRLDSGSGFEDKPAVAFNDGTTYVFDQSHVSNANNTLVIGTTFDVSSSIVSSGLTIMGTPGQPGAYTKYVSDGTPLYYFSYQNQNMGYEKSPQGLFHVFSPELETYRIEIRAKRLGNYKPMNINVIKTDTLGNETTTLVGNNIGPGTDWNNFNLDFTVEPNVNMIRISIEGLYDYGGISFTNAEYNRVIVLDYVKLFHVNDDNTISTTNLLKGYNMDLSSNDERYLYGTNHNGWDIGISKVVQITSNAIFNTGSDDGNVIILHKLGSLYQDLEIQRNYSYVSATQIYNTDVSFINYNSPVGDFSYTDDATKNFQTGSNVYFTYFGGSIESTVTYDNANITNNAWTTPSEGNYTVIATKLGDAYHRDVSASTTFTVSPPNITDDLYVHYDFEFPLYDPTGTERTDGLTGNNSDVRVYNKAYDSSTNSDISYNGYLAPFGHVGGARLDSTVQKFGSSSVKVYESAVRSDFVWNLDSLQGFSMCIWMKEVSASGSLMGAGSPLVFEISYNNSTFTVNISGTTMSYTYTNSDITNITDWNHIAFTMSSDGSTWKLYINGKLVQTKTDGIYFTQSGTINYVDIGARPGWSSYRGYFDDFRFYKTEISAAQVSAVYSYTG